jgi:hypothetical protein
LLQLPAWQTPVGQSLPLLQSLQVPVAVSQPPVGQFELVAHFLQAPFSHNPVAHSRPEVQDLQTPAAVLQSCPAAQSEFCEHRLHLLALHWFVLQLESWEQVWQVPLTQLPSLQSASDWQFWHLPLLQLLVVLQSWFFVHCLHR